MKSEILEQANKLSKQIKLLQEKRTEFLEDDETETLALSLPEKLFPKNIQEMFSDSEIKSFNEFCLAFIDKKIKVKEKEFNNL